MTKVFTKKKKCSCSVVSDSVTVACRAAQSMGFFRQEYLTDLPCPPSGGIFPTQGSNLGLPHCKQSLHRLSHQGSPNPATNIALNGCTLHVFILKLVTKKFSLAWLLFDIAGKAVMI